MTTSYVHKMISVGFNITRGAPLSAMDKALAKSLLETKEIMAANIMNEMNSAIPRFDGHWMNEYEAELKLAKAARE